MVTTPDIQLLRDYAGTSDPQIFAQILRKYHGLVLTACLRVLGNQADAEDATQECFLQLARQADTIRSSLAGWLHRCAVHTSVNLLKQNQARVRRERRHQQVSESYRSEGAQWEDLAPHVDAAIDDLPDRQRYVIVEHFLRQRTQTEIAIEMEVSAATLSRQVHAGVNSLRQRLTRAGITISAALLAALLMERSAQAAPAGAAEGLLRRLAEGSTPNPCPTAAASAPVAPVARTAVSAPAGGGLKVALALCGAALVLVLAAMIFWPRQPQQDAPGPADDGSAVATGAEVGGRGTNGSPSVRWSPVGPAGGDGATRAPSTTVQRDGTAGRQTAARPGGDSWTTPVPWRRVPESPDAREPADVRQGSGAPDMADESRRARRGGAPGGDGVRWRLD